MTDNEVISILAIAVIVIGALCFGWGYFFGKSAGLRESSEAWQTHLKKYVDPFINLLKEQIKFYKELK